MFDALQLAFYKIAASGWIPAKWFESDLPAVESRSTVTGRLSLEIVSHCWNYSHFLIYQLSSLVQFPPRKLDVTMTVYYSSEDEQTCRLLSFFEQKKVPGVRWNWRELPRQKLFRRGIGRNLSALETRADWVWFTDCDLMFRENCLDELASLLQDRKEALVFPEEERTTDLLTTDNPMLKAGSGIPGVLDIDTENFTVRQMSRATGPLQITHGDVCRAVGYCRSLKLFQKPSETWCKAHEDRAFRWLLRTQGFALPIPGVYRIRHIHKGRYTGNRSGNYLRSQLRKFQSWFRDKGKL